MPILHCDPRAARRTRRRALLDLRLAMKRVLAFKLAVLVELKLFLDIATILFGRIVLALALGALQSDQLDTGVLGHLASPHNCGTCKHTESGAKPLPYRHRVDYAQKMTSVKEPSSGIEPLTTSLPWMYSTD